MTKEVVLNGIYKHYKGHNYLVLLIAKDCKDFCEYVVYQKLYDDFDWRIRLKSNFLEDVEIDGVKKERFKFVELKK
jgi:hypothetical protein